MSVTSQSTDESIVEFIETTNVDMDEYTVNDILDGDYFSLVNSNFRALFNIYEQEQEFTQTEIIHGKIYLGCYSFQIRINLKIDIVYGCIISTNSFINYDGILIGMYLTEYDTTTIRNEISNIDLLKLFIKPNGDCFIVVKTFWIRIIQRVWKRIYKENAYKNSLRKTIASLRYFEIYGRYIESARNVCGLSGMLSFLQK